MSMQAAPPGILDLIPWGPSPRHHHEDAFDLNPHIWSHLPDTLLHSILAWLPLQSVLHFRCVCKQWKALFASPAFHHFASHRAHVPPLIFFIGSSISFDDDNENSDAFNHYDDGYDDNGHVYEDDIDWADYVSDDNGSDDNDSDDSIYDDIDGDSHCDDHFMGGDEHEDIHDIMRNVEHANMPDVTEHGDQEDMHVVMRSGDHEDMHDVMRYGDHGDMDDVLSYANSDGDNHCDDRGGGQGDHADMHVVMRPGDHEDVMTYGDHGDMDEDDVLSYDDLGDMHDVIGHDDHGAIHNVDDDFSNGRANDEEAPEEHTDIDLLLIFDCESESWRRPLALPSGFRRKSHRGFLSHFHACTFQEQIMIPSISPYRLFLFNPACPPCKELPPRIAIQNLEAFGFVEERVTLPGAVTWSNLSNLFSISNEEEPRVQDKTAKILQVVAVGDTVNDHHIVESFDSVTGSWHVIGRLPYSDDFIFIQRRMLYCNGCFYALLSSGVLMMSNFQVGQNMKWKFQEFPDPPNGDGGLSGRYTEVVEWDLVATRESVFLIGLTSTEFPYTFQQGDLDILLWQFHPHAPADACWELHAYAPCGLWRTFTGNFHSETMYLAHGDLIFFMVPGRRRFLIYDVPRKLWRFSPICKYFLDIMTFVWEPLLRN